MRRFTGIWEGLVEPAWRGDVKDPRPGRILNIILLFLILWTGVLELQYRTGHQRAGSVDVLILDLDSFKEYNDRWGHPVGDVRLREVANLLHLNVREPDVAARYGGEEFAIILPDTSKPGAVQLAERLCYSAEESAPGQSEDRYPVPGYTLSLGVATFPDDAASNEELLLMADNAELMAKRLGKNRVYTANSSDKIQNP